VREISADAVRRNRALAGQVRRYHTWPTLRTQTVGEHSWRVATIYLELFSPDSRVLEYILWHDAGELTTGDLPYPVKDLVAGLRRSLESAEAIGRSNLGVTLPNLMVEQHKRVKLCDCLEMFEFGVQETAMGNRFGEPVAKAMRDTALGVAATLGNTTLDSVREWIKRVEVSYGN